MDSREKMMMDTSRKGTIMQQAHFKDMQAGELALRRVFEWPPEHLEVGAKTLARQGFAYPAGNVTRYNEQLEVIIDLLHVLITAIASDARTGKQEIRVTHQPHTQQGVNSLTGETYDLTPREDEVLAEMTKGMSNRQIAVALTVSVSTVKSHVSNILSKMGVESRTEAVAVALQRGGSIC